MVLFCNVLSAVIVSRIKSITSFANEASCRRNSFIEDLYPHYKPYDEEIAKIKKRGCKTASFVNNLFVICVSVIDPSTGFYERFIIAGDGKWDFHFPTAAAE